MSCNNANMPLVSVCIASYNSSSTVIETLDSIAAQTYTNLELIVSDDCSTDNTVELVKNWVIGNSDKFVSTKILAAKKNGGISVNGNRAWRAASGEWIKFFAADDILRPTMIQEYMNYASKHSNAHILYSAVKVFGKAQMFTLSQSYWDQSILLGQSLTSAKEQYKALKRSNFMPAASNMIRRDLLNKLGGFDEELLYIEDLPLWLKATKQGEMLHYVNCMEPLVWYRSSEDSVQINNPRFKLSKSLCYSKYFCYNPLYYIFHNFVDQKNHNTFKTRFFCRLIYIGSIPHRVINKLTQK